WIFPACLGGFALNWFVVARPMRRLSLKQGSVTLTEMLADDAPPRLNRAITISASIVVLLSLGTYVASQFQAAGKTFAETLDMEMAHAVLTGGGIVLLYTMSGGFWAASISDLIQGLVMAVAAVIVPIAALIEVGGIEAMIDGLEAQGLADPFGSQKGWAAIGLVVGFLGIGIGYPGQPHVVNRFMAIRSEHDLKIGTWISIVWAVLMYAGMLTAGWCGRVLVDQLADGEGILLRLTTDLFPPVAAGVLIAAVLSAIMSTADSQLLVCGATVAHDLPRRGSSQRVGLDRLAIIGISLAAIVAALTVNETIFSQVLFAWSALGAAFGPLILCRVLRGPVRPAYALTSIWTGFAVTLIWFFTPLLKGALYELIPAFLAASIPAWMGSRGGSVNRSSAGA
ncbi:MAG: sodium/proline symporter, partial [Planctomycetes bacterium]|nr:sodium/proline symporter [Planctomycetota bacterium]